MGESVPVGCLHLCGYQPQVGTWLSLALCSAAKTGAVLPSLPFHLNPTVCPSLARLVHLRPNYPTIQSPSAAHPPTHSLSPLGGWMDGWTRMYGATLFWLLFVCGIDWPVSECVGGGQNFSLKCPTRSNCGLMFRALVVSGQCAVFTMIVQRWTWSMLHSWCYPILTRIFWRKYFD